MVEESSKKKKKKWKKCLQLELDPAQAHKIWAELFVAYEIHSFDSPSSYKAPHSIDPNLPCTNGHFNLSTWYPLFAPTLKAKLWKVEIWNFFIRTIRKVTLQLEEFENEKKGIHTLHRQHIHSLKVFCFCSTEHVHLMCPQSSVWKAHKTQEMRLKSLGRRWTKEIICRLSKWFFTYSIYIVDSRRRHFKALATRLKWEFRIASGAKTRKLCLIEAHEFLSVLSWKGWNFIGKLSCCCWVS